MKLRKIVLATIAVALVAGGACRKPQPIGNRLVIGLASNPITLDPRLGTDVASARVGQLVFNSLLKKDVNSELVPDLAETWERPTETKYVFHLRRGVKFHDGSELTAADVVFTFTSLLSPALNSPKKAVYDIIDKVEAPDEYTVVFTLKEPFTPFPINTVLGIVPRTAGDAASEFGRKPIGTGPYKVESWRSEEEIVLTSNQQAFDGAPALDGITFKIIPDDHIRILELEKGGINFLQNDLPPTALDSLRQNPRWQVVEAPGTNYQYIGFNLNADSPVKNPTVRKALAHALDRGGIIQHLLGGLATPADSLLPAQHWAHASGLPSYDYDLVKAATLLDEAGYSVNPETGYRFGLTFKCSENKRSKQLAEVFQQDLKKVQINVEIRSYEWATFYEDIIKGNFEFFSLTWVGITDPDIYHSLFHSSMIPPNGRNRGRYTNPVVDRLLLESRRTLDRQRLVSLYHTIQRILSEDMPYINLWHMTNVAIIPANLQGFVLYPAGDLTSLQAVTFN